MKKYAFIFKGHSTKLTILGIISVLVSAISIVGVYFNGVFIDTLIDAARIQDIVIISLIILAIFFAGIVLNFVFGYMHGPLKEMAVYDLKEHTLNCVSGADTQHDSTYLSKRIDEDSRQFISFVLENYSIFVIKAVELVVVGVLMFRINLHIGLISLIICPLYFLLYSFFKKPIFERSLDLRENSAGFFKNYTTQLKTSGDKTVVKNSFMTYLGKYKSYTFVNVMLSSSQGMVVSSMQVLIFIIGGVGVLRGSTTIGLLSVTTMYFNQILGIVTYYMNLAKRYQITKASVHRIDEVLAITNRKEVEQHEKNINSRYDHFYGLGLDVGRSSPVR